jgi:hypothetical protein
MKHQPPKPVHSPEDEFLEFLDHVLIDYDDEQWQAKARQIAVHIESSRKENNDDGPDAFSQPVKR